MRQVSIRRQGPWSGSLAPRRRSCRGPACARQAKINWRESNNSHTHTHTNCDEATSPEHENNPRTAQQWEFEFVIEKKRREFVGLFEFELKRIRIRIIQEQPNNCKKDASVIYKHLTRKLQQANITAYSDSSWDDKMTTTIDVSTTSSAENDVASTSSTSSSGRL